jgi:hypothetical protein
MPNGIQVARLHKKKKLKKIVTFTLSYFSLASSILFTILKSILCLAKWYAWLKYQVTY